MSACYSVKLSIRVKNEKEAYEKVKEFMCNEKDTNFSVEDFKKEGVDVNTLDGLIRVILAGWLCTPYKKEITDNGLAVYTNDFNASYGWENVMMNFFDAIAPCLEDKSMIFIEPDSDYDKAIVKNGKAKWIH